MENIYITTPIYYVNDVPHIGHCYTSIVSDIIARMHSVCGFNVRLQTGTDEHGQKIHQSAQKAKTNEMLFCNNVSDKFRTLSIDLNMISSYDEFNSTDKFNRFSHLKYLPKERLFNNGRNFIRTTDGRDLESGMITNTSKLQGKHIKVVEYFWNKLLQNDWIYEDKYSGWYSVRDEAFFDESELVNSKAPTGSDVEFREERAYFFKLSAIQDVLLNLYLSQYRREIDNIIMPQSKLNETISFIAGTSIENVLNGIINRGSLRDLCISRYGMPWGIPIPNDNECVIYVWLDALVNYLSALSYPNGQESQKWWKDSRRIHIVGKDILRFHALYWPAFLIAEKYNISEISSVKICDVQKLIPSKIFAHGWWTNDGEKMSKSLNNAINPYHELDYIVSTFRIDRKIALDYLRYYLVRAMPLGNDGDFSRERFMTIVNGEIVNNIGNLVQRIVSMISKICNNGNNIMGAKLLQSDLDFIYTSRWIFGKNITEYYEKITSDFDIYKLLDDICSFATLNNTYVEQKMPWNMIKNGNASPLYSLMRCIFHNISLIAIFLRPIVPIISESILDILLIKSEHRLISALDHFDRFDEMLDLDVFSSNILVPERHLCPRLVMQSA